MAEAEDAVAQLVLASRRGSVVAAAGCGKTEQIALATKVAVGRRLILTHTHAGKDALQARLRDHGVSTADYALDTIAGWCLRYAASFPKRSGRLATAEPKTDADWVAVYDGAKRVLQSGAVDRVIPASYSGAFVDEYQDCVSLQHDIVVELARLIPVCVFGDPLQAIFDFKGQQPVDWEKEVFPIFGEAGRLTKPWRWVKAGNPDLARWLEGVRASLDANGSLDFRTLPSCVTHKWLPTNEGPRRGVIIGATQKVMGRDGRLVVIDDPANLNGRAALARALSKYGFSNIEPVGCPNVFAAARTLGVASGTARLNALLAFVDKCMAGAETPAFREAVASRQAGGKLGTAKFGTLVDLGVIVIDSPTDANCLALLDGFYEQNQKKVFRREMFYSMRSALRLIVAGTAISLNEALWQVQNRGRHAGRHISGRSIGSTLLVKGLEFEHAVVIHTTGMSRKDWYVALTRATTTLTILSPTDHFTPAA